MRLKNKKPDAADIHIQTLEMIFREIEQLQKQIGELTVALRHNDAITHEQAWRIINGKPEEEET